MTEMPPLPEVGDMNWAGKIKTYLEAIQSRGDLPDRTDLDKVHGMDWVGSWQLRGGNTYYNLPSSFPLGISASLEVVYGGNVGTVHRITMGNPDGSESGVWWREVALYNSIDDMTWSPWHNSVVGEGVRKIITSPDYDYPLKDGELLVVTPSQKYFEDFSNNPIGSGIPSGWSRRWDTSGDWEIISDASAQGGRVLRGTGGDGTARRGLRWAIPGTISDAEIVIRHRAGRADTAGRPLLRAGGNVGEEQCYMAIVQTSNISLDSLNPTVRIDTIPHPYPWEVDAWFITRLRAQGNQIKARTWPSSTPEPNDWHLTGTHSGHTSGWVGVQRFGNSVLDIDWVGVSVGGGLAPTGRF